MHDPYSLCSPVYYCCPSNCSGSIVVVNVKIWLLCSTKQDADQFGTFAGANDEMGMENMESLGLGVEVHSGMKAKIIDSDWLRYQIRLLDGENAGYLGWLPQSSSRPSSPRLELRFCLWLRRAVSSRQVRVTLADDAQEER